MLHINGFYRTFLLVVIVALGLTHTAYAQDDYPPMRNNTDTLVESISTTGFKKENIFAGGNFTASFGSGYTVLGVSPMLGYKLNNYFDAGIVVNYVYTGMSDYPVIVNSGYEYAKVRQHTFGPGAFVRAYPVPFLFAQAQLEENFTNERYTINSQQYKYNYNATSLLLGAGYASGRTKTSNTFYYMAILFDVLKNEKSPYVDVDYDTNTGSKKVTIQPIIRAGFNISLFPGRYKYYDR